MAATDLDRHYVMEISVTTLGVLRCRHLASRNNQFARIYSVRRDAPLFAQDNNTYRKVMSMET